MSCWAFRGIIDFSYTGPPVIVVEYTCQWKGVRIVRVLFFAVPSFQFLAGCNMYVPCCAVSSSAARRLIGHTHIHCTTVWLKMCLFRSINNRFILFGPNSVTLFGLGGFSKRGATEFNKAAGASLYTFFRSKFLAYHSLSSRASRVDKNAHVPPTVSACNQLSAVPHFPSRLKFTRLVKQQTEVYNLIDVYLTERIRCVLC